MFGMICKFGSEFETGICFLKIVLFSKRNKWLGKLKLDTTCLLLWSVSQSDFYETLLAWNKVLYGLITLSVVSFLLMGLLNFAFVFFFLL